MNISRAAVVTSPHGDYVISSRPNSVPRRPLDLPSRLAVPSPRDSPGGPGLLIRLDERQPGRPVIRMHGVVDRSAAAPARRAMYEALVDAPHVVVVDLRGVTAMDGAGAVLMVAMGRHARRLASSLQVVGARPAVRAALRERHVEALLDVRG